MKRLIICLFLLISLPSTGFCMTQARYDEIDQAFKNSLTSLHQYHESFNKFDSDLQSFEHNLSLMVEQQNGGVNEALAISFLQGAYKRLKWARYMLHLISKRAASWTKSNNNANEQITTQVVLFEIITILTQGIILEKDLISALNHKVKSIPMLTQNKKIIYLVEQISIILDSEAVIAQRFFNDSQKLISIFRDFNKN